MNLESYLTGWSVYLGEKAVDAFIDRDFETADRIDKQAQLIWDKAMKAARYGA